MKSPLIQRCYQVITSYHMLRKGDAVLVGVSGGPDSMALLHLMLALASRMDLRLGMAHLNHSLRQKASDADERFVKSVAAKTGVPVFIEKRNISDEQKKTGLSLEEAGREARYHFFNTICREHGFTKIAVGHHREDNAEQILLNLLRGSGPSGLRGICPVRGNIIRPLIQTARSEILDFLTLNKIEFVIDHTNEDTQFLRNRVRHRLMPLLRREYNPNLSETLNRLGLIAHAEEDWLSTLIDPLFEAALIRSDDRQTILSVPELMSLHTAALRRVLRKAIHTIKKDLRRINFLHIDSAMQLIAKNPPDARLDLPGRIRIVKADDRLIIRKELNNLRTSREEKALPIEFTYNITKDAASTNFSVFIEEINTRISFHQTRPNCITRLSRPNGDTAFLDWDTIRFPIIIRNPRPGDRFSPIGMIGTQKLKKFFNNNKIKPATRATTPIMVSGDVIAWVGGFRIAEPFKITQRTKTVLKVEISSSGDIR